MNVEQDGPHGTITGVNGSVRLKWTSAAMFRICSAVPKQQMDRISGSGSGSASHAWTTRYLPGGVTLPSALKQASTTSGPDFRYSAAPPRTSLFPVETNHLMSSGSGWNPVWARPPIQQPSFESGPT